MFGVEAEDTERCQHSLFLFPFVSVSLCRLTVLVRAGIYANYATNSALFRGQYGAGRSNNTHHPHHNAAAPSAAPNSHYQNSAAAAVAAAAPGGPGAGAGAMGYPATAAAASNSSSHWNPVESSAPSVPTFDYAATAPHP